LLTACSACGSQRAQPPTLARADAQPLIVLAQRIAGEGACAQQRDIPLLQHRAIALVNARRVPPELQDTFISGVNALAADTPPCVPPVPVATPAPPPPPHGHEKHHHEKHHGHEGRD
jgi:hypothetical protein